MVIPAAHVDPPSFLTVPGGTIAYRDSGPRDAPGLVLLHGGAVDGRMWARQIATLADRFRVVVPDARGHGASGTPVDGYRPHEDVVALVEHLDVVPGAVVGLSMGARVAGDLAVERPDLCGGVVLSGAGFGDPSFTEPWATRLFARWERARTELDAAGWIETFMEFVDGPHRGPADVDPLVRDEVRLMAVDVLVHHMPADPAGPPPSIGFLDDAAERAGSLAVPLLGIVGEQDGADHRRMVADAVAAVPRGDLVTTPGAGHYPNMERPAEFTDAVLRFVTGRAAGSSAR